MKIAAIIITKNEQDMIKDCIMSLGWVDEILVVDSQSDDNTAEIATRLGVKVIVHPFKDFADQRNFAFRQTSAEWILYVDADERISLKLAEQIKTLLNGSNAKDAYRLRRQNYYFGKRWPHDDHLERLFKRHALVTWYGLVHESPKITGLLGSLNESLLHFTHTDLDSMLSNTIIWSKIEADLRLKANHPPITRLRLIKVALSSFVNSYFNQRGFSAGTVGIVESIYQAYSMFITYARLWEMQQKKLK